jgi:hypothetical protein
VLFEYLDGFFRGAPPILCQLALQQHFSDSRLFYSLFTSLAHNHEIETVKDGVPTDNKQIINTISIHLANQE